MDPLAADNALAERVQGDVATGQDPAALVEAAVELDVAAPDRGPAVDAPNADDLREFVAEWYRKSAETADFAADVKQADADAITLAGGSEKEIADAGESTINYVYRNAIQTVAHTAPEMAHAEWKPAEQVEPPPGVPIPPEVRHQQVLSKGLAQTLGVVFRRLARQARIQDKIEAWIQDAVHFRMAVVKMWFAQDLASDPTGRTRLPDQQDLVARIRVLVEARARGEVMPGDAKYQELRNALEAQGNTEPARLPGLVLELVPLRQYRCDSAVDGPEALDQAEWERHDIPMRRREILAQWAHIGPDDLAAGIVYQVDETGRMIRRDKDQRTRTSRDTTSLQDQLPATAPDDEDWLLVSEIYDYETNHRLVLIEGLPYPAVMEPHAGGSPFHVLVLNRWSGRLSGASDTELQAKAQRAINKNRSQQEDAKRLSRPKWAADLGKIPSATDLKRVEDAAPGTITGVQTQGADLKDAIIPVATTNSYDPAEYDTSQYVNEMHRMAMLPDDALKSNNFSSEVQTAAAVASVLFRYRQARIARVLTQLADVAGRLILAHVGQEDAVKIAGPFAAMYWPAEPLKRIEMQDLLSVEVQVSLDKQLDSTRKAEALIRFLDATAKNGAVIDREKAAEMLADLLGIEDARGLIKSDPNELIQRLLLAMQEAPPGAVAPEALAMLAQLGMQAAQQMQAITAEQQAAEGGQPGSEQVPA